MADFWINDANWSLIPPHMHEGIKAHVMEGQPVGGFLTLVLEDAPLSAVTAKADGQNRLHLHEWVVFLYNYTPSQCHGSRAKVEAWQKTGGINGQRRKAEAASGQ